MFSRVYLCNQKRNYVISDYNWEIVLYYDPVSAAALSVSLVALNYVVNFVLAESKNINCESQTELLTKYFLLKKIEFNQELQSNVLKKKIDKPNTNFVLPDYQANDNYKSKLIIKNMVLVISDIVTQTPVLTIGKLLSICRSIISYYPEQKCEKNVYQENRRIIQKLQLSKWSEKDLEVQLLEAERALKVTVKAQRNTSTLNPLMPIKHNKRIIEDKILNYKRNTIKSFLDNKGRKI